MTDDELEATIKDEFAKALPKMHVKLLRRECSFGAAFSVRTEFAVELWIPAEDAAGDVRCRVRDAARNLSECMFEHSHHQLLPHTMLAISRPLNEMVDKFVHAGENPFSAMPESVGAR